MTDTVQGVAIVDNYRWLEGDNSNPKEEGVATPEVSAWTDAQNAFTRSVLDSLPGRKELEERLRPLMEVGTVTAPQARGGRYFYRKREGNQNQALIYVREGVNGTPRVLLDPAQIDSTGLTTIEWFDPSENGKQLLYGTYRAGDENTTLHLFDVDGGKTLPLEIPSKTRGSGWLPDGSGFFYGNLLDAKNPYSGQVKFHKLGAEVGQDPLLIRQFTPEENKKLATTFGPFGFPSRDGKWLILGYSTGTRNNDLWSVELAKYWKTGKVERNPIVVGEEAQSNGPVSNGVMYMLTTLGAPNGRVVTVPLADPARAHWKEIIPERKDAVIESVQLAKDALVVTYLHNATSRIELFSFDGKSRGELRLPGIGTAGITTDESSNEAFVTFASFNYPSSILRVDLTQPTAEPIVWERPAVPVDPQTVEVKQEWYTSKDGTKVSMFVVHKKA